jgi:choline dehydrogenase-like flavoprotein
MINFSSYDVIVIGAGVSGSFIARDLSRGGCSTLVLEAGSSFTRHTYPRQEIDANSRLYWGGGVELNTSATLALLRPKVVGGGSVVNQALMDRFDENALDSWRSVSGVNFFTEADMAPWYAQAEADLIIQEIPARWRNGNAEIFEAGFERNGFKCAPLKRAQRDCRFEDGNDCIECLAGCRIDSKQSMPVTVLKEALQAGTHLISDFEVEQVNYSADWQQVSGRWRDGRIYSFKARKVVLAAGAIGNSRLLLASGFKKKLPAVGERFFTHPQYMVLALYDKVINAHKGPLQSYKSADSGFRLKGFKLENVFAPPVGLSMLIPGHGQKHFNRMKQITHMACVEVAVRDTAPGSIRINNSGRPVIKKELNGEDQKRKEAGLCAINDIFQATGAREIIPGDMGIGLHLMGGCGIGVNGATSVASPDFTLHDHRHIVLADSSVFPDAPGINPSLTIMALSRMAAANLLKEGR